MLPKNKQTILTCAISNILLPETCTWIVSILANLSIKLPWLIYMNVINYHLS